MLPAGELSEADTAPPPQAEPEHLEAVPPVAPPPPPPPVPTGTRPGAASAAPAAPAAPAPPPVAGKRAKALYDYDVSAS